MAIAPHFHRWASSAIPALRSPGVAATPPRRFGRVGPEAAEPSHPMRRLLCFHLPVLLPETAMRRGKAWRNCHSSAGRVPLVAGMTDEGGTWFIHKSLAMRTSHVCFLLRASKSQTTSTMTQGPVPHSSCRHDLPTQVRPTLRRALGHQPLPAAIGAEEGGLHTNKTSSESANPYGSQHKPCTSA